MWNFLQQEREREAKKWILNLARSAEAQFIVPKVDYDKGPARQAT